MFVYFDNAPKAERRFVEELCKSEHLHRDNLKHLPTRAGIPTIIGFACPFMGNNYSNSRNMNL